MRLTRSTVPAGLRRFEGSSLLLLSLTILLSLAGTPAQAQLPQTRLYSVSPLGAKVGTTLDVNAASGADLDELSQIHFNHPGITGVRKTNDAGAPVGNTFVVTVAADVPPGLFAVRVSGLFGLSNPRTFTVGTRDEAAETEANNTPEQATPLEVGRVYNGAIGSATDIDFFKFPGKAGRRIIIDCRATRIDSRLEAALELYDSAGRRLAHARNTARRDPLLDVTLPADGEYTIKLFDYVYRGGADYFYRLTVNSDAYVDFILPPAGAAGSTGQYTVYGRNLPGGQPSGQSIDGQPLDKLDVEITLPADATLQQSVENLLPAEAGVDGATFTLDTPNGPSNAVFVHFSDAPVGLEAEPNNEPGAAQKISIPGDVAGQFQAKGDVDTFEFEAKAKEVYFIEVFGERHGSTIDPYVLLEQITRDDKGNESKKQITVLDDNGTNASANLFDTLTDDPVYRFEAPADGLYRITMHDRYFESRGDPRLVYRLSIRKPKPDYRLVAFPYVPADGAAKKGSATWAVGLRKGGNRAVDVLALRRDGFAGAIQLSVEGLPEGVTCPGAVMTAGQNAATLVFTAAENAAEWTGTVQIVGTAKQGETELRHVARSGTILWDGIPAVSRVSRQFGLSVMKEQAPYQLTADVQNVEVNQGRQILVPIKLTKRTGFDADVALTFLSAPKNTDVENKPIKKGAADGLYRVFVKNNAPVGTYTIFLNSQGQVSYRRNIFLVERAKAQQTALTKTATDTAEIAKKSAETLTAATKAATDAQAALKAAADAKVAAEKKVTDSAAAAKAAVDEKPKAIATAAQSADAAAKKAAEALVAANKALTGDGPTIEKKLEDALAASTSIAAELAAARKSLTDTQSAADKKVADTATAAKTAQAELAAATATVTKSDTAAKAAEKARADAEAKKKADDDAAKKTADAKAAGDKAVADAEAKTKAANVNVFFPSTPIVLTIKPAPGTLAAAVPESGNLKQGGKLDVKVTLERKNGFKGPVTLELPLPPGIKGISAAGVTIPADKKEGVISIQAAADAPEAQLANMVVRGSMEFNGKAAIDVPVAIKVIK